MTGLIKSRDAGDRVRPVDVARPTAPPLPAQVVDVETVALRREIESLTKALRDRETEIDFLRGDLDRAFKAGEADGRASGLQEGAERGAAALKVLELGVDRALRAVSHDLSALERLAVQLALEGLSKVFGDASERAALVAEIIRKQVAELEAASIVRIDVAREDFADQAALRALAVSLGHPGLVLDATGELSSGDCRIKLILGGLEVGVDQQWSRLEAALEELAHPGVAR